MRLMNPYLLATTVYTLLLLPAIASAQVRPDGTTPTPNPGSCAASCTINGGTTVGSNLFHSFTRFSVPTNGEVIFNTDVGIRTIIARVTGDFVSRIDGNLQTDTANLFLLNPNGVILGPNAELNVGGAFVVSTADSVLFSNGLEFSATNPESPPLLAVRVPIGLQYGSDPGAIEVQGSLNGGDRQSLLLGGGNLQFADASLSAPGGRLDLAAIGADGLLDLNGNANHLRFDVSRDVPRLNVTLSNTVLDVAADRGGSITLGANNLRILDGSELSAGILANQGFTNRQAGDIVLDVAGNLVIENSLLSNTVQLNGVGSAGNIVARADNLTIRNALLDTASFGLGDAGNLRLRVGDRLQVVNSNLLSSLESDARGRGGNIDITTGSLIARQGSRFIAESAGQGSAGNVFLEAETNVLLDNASIFSRVRRSATGNGGSIGILAENLRVENRSQLTTSISGEGNAGRISLEIADQLVFRGLGAAIPNNEEFQTGAFSQIRGSGVGLGGNVRIQATDVRVLDGAQLSASTRGDGDAGEVFVNADHQIRVENSELLSEVRGDNAVNAGRVQLRAVDDIYLLNSRLSSAGRNNSLDGSFSNITAISSLGSLFVYRSELSAANDGRGFAGDIVLDAAEEILVRNSRILNQGRQGRIFVGNLADGRTPAGADRVVLSSNVLNSQGQNGLISIQSPEGSLRLSRDRLTTESDTVDEVAGSIILNGRDRLFVYNSQLSSNGENGRIIFGSSLRNAAELGDIVPNLVTITNSTVSSTTSGELGNAGSIVVRADNLDLVGRRRTTTTDDTQVFSTQLSAATTGEGNAGNIVFDIGNATTLFQVALTSRVEEGSEGDAGNIRMSSGSLLAQDSTVTVSNLEEGEAGNIALRVGEVVIDQGSNIVAETSSGSGGNIRILGSNVIFLRRGGTISTTASGGDNGGTDFPSGDGGNIVLNSAFISGVLNQDNDIVANAEIGDGGEISIRAVGILGLEVRSADPDPNGTNDIDASSQYGQQGQITVGAVEGFDPTQGVIELQTAVVDVSGLVAQECRVDRDVAESLGEFYLTGRGGLPISPEQTLTQTTVPAEWVQPPEVPLPPQHSDSSRLPSADVPADVSADVPSDAQRSSPDSTIVEAHIVEAQDWAIAPDGTVELIAAPDGEPDFLLFSPAFCQGGS
jgi:filamentous hemagglutinin family protein